MSDKSVVLSSNERASISAGASELMMELFNRMPIEALKSVPEPIAKRIGDFMVANGYRIVFDRWYLQAEPHAHETREPLIDWKASYEEALRQRDALQTDANRYRWLREFTYVEAYYIDGAGGVDTKIRAEGSVDHLDLAVDLERIKDRPAPAQKAFSCGCDGNRLACRQRVDEMECSCPCHGKGKEVGR